MSEIDLKLAQRDVFDSLKPYGTYLQRMVVPDGVQAYDADPGLYFLAGLIVGEFLKGLFAELGKKLADQVGQMLKRTRKGQAKQFQKSFLMYSKEF